MYYCKGIISIKKIIIILLLIITSSRAFSQGPYQHVNKATRIKLDWGYKPKIYLVAGVKNIGGYLFRQSLMDIPKNHKDAISIGLKEAAKQGLAKLNCEIREEFEIFLNRPWEHKANPHFEIWIEY